MNTPIYKVWAVKALSDSFFVEMQYCKINVSADIKAMGNSDPTVYSETLV